ncbi:hypothetical protein L6250_01410 [Candidatus Parcubacteria bacterium]|nr:hypothetical protein [Patescibacteria group bacterium]MBU4466904.1 hypothetical protein [Patescibacteria group bacterium]MCG2688273.1 hypothetical protein [Candidatus Parcubacteria bacterium]
MFGPIFVIIGFFVCLFFGYFFCKLGGYCKANEFGVSAIIAVFILAGLLIALKIYLPAP